jgi:hypothetical protein
MSRFRKLGSETSILAIADGDATVPGLHPTSAQAQPAEEAEEVPSCGTEKVRSCGATGQLAVLRTRCRHGFWVNDADDIVRASGNEIGQLMLAFRDVNGFKIAYLYFEDNGTTAFCTVPVRPMGVCRKQKPQQCGNEAACGGNVLSIERDLLHIARGLMW